MSTWYESTEKALKVSPINTMTTRTMSNTVSAIARTILIYNENMTGMQHISRSGTQKEDVQSKRHGKRKNTSLIAVLVKP